MDSYEAEQLGRYSSLSSQAIASFVLALCSLLSLLVPILLVGALVALVLAGTAWRKIAASEGRLTGSWLARAAVFLCVFCLVATPVRFMVRSSMYRQQADQLARRWLALIAEEKLDVAVNQITGDAMRSFYPPPADGSPQTPPSTEQLAERLSETPLCQQLSEMVVESPLPLNVRRFELHWKGSNPYAMFEYELPSDGNPLILLVYAIRYDPPGGVPSWRVDSWRLNGL